MSDFGEIKKPPLCKGRWVCKANSEGLLMREYKTHKILNAIIYVLYIPLSFFGFMCGMATDGLIDETNNLIITFTNIFAYMGLFMPIICLVCYFVSKKITENKSLSIVIKLIPFFVLILMIILDFVVMNIR